jgi:hypothetical protein
MVIYMKRALLVFVLFTSLGVPASSAAATFKNCSQLNKVYPHGVAKSAAASKKQKMTPKVSAAIYSANLKMDRDKDGTVCEK